MFSRRRFVQGLGSGGLLLASGPRAFAAARPGELTGPQFDLTIDTLPVNITGAPQIGRAHV